MAENEALKNIKIVLGINDNLQDAVLEVLIRNVTKHLVGLLKKVNKNLTEVPGELGYIVEEITIRRFNRIGTEGMKTESVEGHRVDFYDLKDEFVPYQEIIEGYAEEPEDNGGRGKVMFI